MDAKEKFTKLHMDSIQPQHLTIAAIPGTIKSSYEQGFDDADSVWRMAIQRYCKNHEIPLMGIFGNILREVSEIAKSIPEDRVIYLFDKEVYRKSYVDGLSREDCEKLVSKSDYEDDWAITKIDPKGTSCMHMAICAEGFDPDDYLIRSFGFREDILSIK